MNFPIPQGFSQMRSGTNNFNQAFNPHKTLIDRIDFKNNGGLLHNNIGDIVYTEKISEALVYIDGEDRAKTNFPNPFNFTVTFGGVGTSTDTKLVGNTFVKTIYEGTPKPIIGRKFKNVKYIRLNHVIIPRTNVIAKTGNPNDPEYSLASTDTNLDAYKFLVLRIKELDNNKVFATNSIIGDDCFILYPDRTMGAAHSMWIPTNGNRVYSNASLFNLKRMTIELADDEGNLLEAIDTDNNKLNMNDILTNLINTKSSTDPIRVAFAKIEKIIRIHLDFTIGYVECEQNTNTKNEA
jgi:hypothetical protein